MAGETPRQVIIGLLEQLLRSTHAGHVDGVIVGVVTHISIDDAGNLVANGTKGARRVASIFAAGDIVNAQVETAMSDVGFSIGDQGYKQFYWNRIPQEGMLP
jgi:hypothetical protein